MDRYTIRRDPFLQETHRLIKPNHVDVDPVEKVRNDFLIPNYNNNNNGSVERVIQLKDRIEELFNVDLTINEVHSTGQWLQIYGLQECVSQAQEYIKSVTTNCPFRKVVDFPREFLTGFMLEDDECLEIERETCAVIDSTTEDSVIIVTGYTELIVGLATSALEAKIQERNKKKYDEKELLMNIKDDINNITLHRSNNTEGEVWFDQSTVDYYMKLGYDEGQICEVLTRLGPSASKDEVLSTLVITPSRVECGPTRTWDNNNANHQMNSSPLSSLSTRNSLDPEENCEKCNIRLKPIVVDGSNVAMNHGNNLVFSCRGIKLAVDHFLSLGHTDITVFVPQWRKESPTSLRPMKDQGILFKLHSQGLLSWTPSRRLEQGKHIVCHDDRFIVRLAVDKKAVIVSNDTFRDIQTENPDWAKWIHENLLMFTFVEDKFMIPDDPLGKDGPTLTSFLQCGSSSNPKRSVLERTVCPYGRRCTYGAKCKYYHSDREQIDAISIRLRKQAENRTQDLFLKSKGLKVQAGGPKSTESPSNMRRVSSYTPPFPITPPQENPHHPAVFKSYSDPTTTTTTTTTPTTTEAQLTFHNTVENTFSHMNLRGTQTHYPPQYSNLTTPFHEPSRCDPVPHYHPHIAPPDEYQHQQMFGQMYTGKQLIDETLTIFKHPDQISNPNMHYHVVRNHSKSLQQSNSSQTQTPTYTTGNLGWNNGINSPNNNPNPPTIPHLHHPPDPSHHRFRDLTYQNMSEQQTLVFNDLCRIFPPAQVRAAMKNYPQELDAQNLCRIMLKGPTNYY